MPENRRIPDQLTAPASTQFRIIAACAVLSLSLWLMEDVLFGPDAAGLGYKAFIWGLALFSIFWSVIGRQSFAKRFVGTASPAALAYVRILCTSVLLANTLWEDLASTALLPAAAAQPMGVLQYFHMLPGATAFFRNAECLLLLEWGTALFLLLGLLGLRTRIVLPLACLGYLLLAGLLREYAWFYHTGLVPLWILFVLCFTPCGDALSLDARARQRRGDPTPAASEVYAWSRYACWAVLAAAYVNAGLSKILIGGLEWVTTPLNLKSKIVGDSMRVMEFDWGIGPLLVDMPDAFFMLLAVATILSEVGYVFVLFSRRARIFMPILLAGMHIGILFMQNVFFFDLILMQLVFLSDPVLTRGLRKIGVEVPKSSGAAEHESQYPGTADSTLSLTRQALLSALVSMVLATFLAVCTQHLKFFPLSAFPMYAGVGTQSVVRYVEVVGITASGEVVEIQLDDEIGALADGRSKRFLHTAFSGRAVLLDQVLETWGALYNTGRPMEDQIVEVVVTRKKWDYELESHDPEHGRIIGRYTYRLRDR